MLRSMKDLEQYGVTAAEGDVGSVADFLFDASTWRVRSLVVDTGGLLSRRRVLIPPNAFGRVDYGAKLFRLAFSAASVENTSPVSERDYPASTARPGQSSPESPLRSARKITGYHIGATDGEIGHVQDLVVDDETWVIQYMVVATTNWWPGKLVLISPQSATRIRWVDRMVDVRMTRAAIQSSPEWSSTYPVDDAYTQELARYYGGIPGWRGRDRSLEHDHTSTPADAGRATERGDVARANARAAAHEESQIRAADNAVIRDAREGRMP